MCIIMCPEWRMGCTSRDFHCVSPTRCDVMRGGRLPVTLLAASVVGAAGEAAGESSWTQGGSQEPWAVEENLLAPAAGPPAAAAVAGAQQGPGQALRHHTRYGRAAVCPSVPAFDCFYLRLRSLQGCTTVRGKSPAATAWKTWPWTTSWSSPTACRGSKFVRRTSWLWFRPASPDSTSCSCFTSGRRQTTTWTWPKVCCTVWGCCVPGRRHATCSEAWRRSAASLEPTRRTSYTRRCLSACCRMRHALKLWNH